MNKKTTLKGFTLLELIIVMAIFSLLLVGSMQLVDPVTRMFSNAAVSEKTYSYTNNIQAYIQGKLEYADNLWIYTSDHIGDNDLDVTDAELVEIAENFRNSYYDNVMIHTLDVGGSETDVYTNGSVYIMKLINQEGVAYPKGQITLRRYDFNSSSAITGASTDEEVQLNPAYFDAQDAAYTFYYTLGASEFVTVDTPTGGDSSKTYRALSSDFNDDVLSVNYNNLSLSIVTGKGEAFDDTHTDIVSGETKDYKAFELPGSLSIANLPLTNISFRKNKPVSRYLRTDTGAYETQNLSSVRSFYSYINNSADFSQDIYFIFAYADELIASTDVVPEPTT